ncbi:SRPBCC family protein [Pyrobaculum neutrophilum]|uniref:Coenzyme Q-binding protein COQ10 START domain-containing protein n=1 Tax=Pyrobaculum neutrophilum (strain DSM 2338 / JCM 9278 / NBRC 100436 / V24Sta) TaxID=444157 RepID=B1YAT3_PYRNV|nr:SRPBCC family protein [Pyrobaculum neutrophilum]ACB39162.1 conserved hypothetical protein [Pyrobaculum neutrophilum V24Sta]
MAVRFKVERKTESPDSAWAKMSDVENMPRYWGGHREVKILERRGSLLLAQVRFAFPGPLNKAMAEVYIDGGRREVVMRYLKGPFTGTVVNYVRNNVVGSIWDVRLHPLFRIAKPWIENHFRKGVEHAVEQLTQT